MTQSDGKDMLKVDGYLDTQSPPGEHAGLRVLMVRDSAVLIEIITWNSETVPASASFAKLTSNVQATLQKSWTQVPTVVLPAGVLPASNVTSWPNPGLTSVTTH